MTSITITDLTNAKADVDHIAAVATSLALTATDRLGGVKSTLSAAIDSIKTFTNRGAWVTATAYVGKDLVSSGGSWYVCVIAHTASASFGTDVANWRLYQGVTSGDMAAPGGAAGMGFIAEGVNASATTVQAKLREIKSPQDDGVVADGVTDDTTDWGNWVSDAGSKYIPAGSYLVSGLVKTYKTPTFVNTADTNHTAGLYAGEKLTTGNANTCFGYNAGAAITTGDQNTSIGKSALETMQAGSNNTAIGFSALRYANDATCVQNTIVGSFCGEQITTGNNNTALGHNTLKTLTTGDLNTAIGQGALAYTVTGNYNTAIGYHALLNRVADDSTAMGAEALMACTTGVGNTAFGRGALKSVVTGQLNTAVGHQAGRLVTGNGNTIVGESAAYASTTGSSNTVVGNLALSANTTGSSNTAIGLSALASAQTASNNTAVGRYALVSATAGTNTAVGDSALYGCTSGTQNVAVGKGALQAVTTETNCAGIGYEVAVTGSNQVQLGNSSATTYAYGAVQNRSDARDKSDVRDTVLGLSFIDALRPVDFRWDLREDYGWRSKDGSQKRTRYHHGLIAQDVKAVIDASGVDFGGFQNHGLHGGKDVLSLGYEELIAPLIKAVQELSARIQVLEGL